MSLFEAETTSPKLEDFVGEGKKYRDPDAVAKAIVEKDAFIARLQSENEQIRQAIPTPVVDRSQEILDRLEALNRTPEPVTPSPVHAAVERTEFKGLSVEDVDRILTERERKAKADSNIRQVKQTLIEKFGDKYPQALKSMAEKNGLGTQFLDQMAAESPQALLNLMGTEKPETFFSPPASVIQPGTFVPTAGTPRTDSYYKKLAATDKKTYFSATVQNQMYKDAMKLGESFYDV